MAEAALLAISSTSGEHRILRKSSVRTIIGNLEERPVSAWTTKTWNQSKTSLHHVPGLTQCSHVSCGLGDAQHVHISHFSFESKCIRTPRRKGTWGGRCKALDMQRRAARKIRSPMSQITFRSGHHDDQETSEKHTRNMRLP